MSTDFEKLSDEATSVADAGSFKVLAEDFTEFADTSRAANSLAALPVGARLIIRCRADWRTACVSHSTSERITIIIHSPRGGTYRIRRPPDTPLQFDNSIPILNITDAECRRATWLGGMAIYDVRW